MSDSWSLLAFPLLASCVWPTTVGLRTDALLPPAGKVEVVAGGGGGDVLRQEETYLRIGDSTTPIEYRSRWLGGGGLSIGLRDDLSLAVGAASDDFGWLATEIELRRRFRDGSASNGWDLVGLAGISPILSFEGGDFLLGNCPGLQGGFSAGHPMGKILRVYGGGRLNLVPIFEDESDLWVWAHPALGITARPPLTENLALVFGLEAFLAVGILPEDALSSGGGLAWVGVGPRR